MRVSARATNFIRILARNTFRLINTISFNLKPMFLHFYRTGLRAAGCRLLLQSNPQTSKNHRLWVTTMNGFRYVDYNSTVSSKFYIKHLFVLYLFWRTLRQEQQIIDGLRFMVTNYANKNVGIPHSLWSIQSSSKSHEISI